MLGAVPDITETSLTWTVCQLPVAPRTILINWLILRLGIMPVPSSSKNHTIVRIAAIYQPSCKSWNSSATNLDASASCVACHFKQVKHLCDGEHFMNWHILGTSYHTLIPSSQPGIHHLSAVCCLRISLLQVCFVPCAANHSVAASVCTQC